MTTGMRVWLKEPRIFLGIGSATCWLKPLPVGSQGTIEQANLGYRQVPCWTIAWDGYQAGTFACGLGIVGLDDTLPNVFGEGEYNAIPMSRPMPHKSSKRPRRR